MDEEANQEDAIAAVFDAIASNNNQVCPVLPEYFAIKVLEIIQKGVKRIPSTCYSCQHSIFGCQDSNCNHQHPNCSCTHVATCSECMILSALSAVGTVFEFLEERNINTTNSSDSSAIADSHFDDNIEATSADCLHLRQRHSKTAMENWYFNTARLLSSKIPTHLLVNCLMSSDKFKSFLARKVLISGMNIDLIEASQVLTLLKQECLAIPFCVPLLELLKDMMSRKKCKNRKINSKTFLLFKEMEFHCLIGARFSEHEKSFVATSGFLEYLSLLCKVVKYVICSLEIFDVEDMAFIVQVVEKICLPFGDYFFTIPIADKGLLICSQYVKVINIILDIKFLENSSTQDKICQISKCLRTKIHTYLKMAEQCGLLYNTNFIGAKLNSHIKNSMNSTSSLKRLIIILVLKTSAFALKGGHDCSISIEHDLDSFWGDISSSVSKSQRDCSKDWLPVVFADQDDQWITALICLLIIHKELDKCRQKELKQISEKTLDCQETSSPTLQQTICPHRLFLQLVRFIDYDHLVLTDFLSSPETPFLFYFTQYVHVIIEDWQGFLSAFVNKAQVSSVDNNNVHELEISILSPISAPTNSSALHNDTLKGASFNQHFRNQENSYSLHPKVDDVFDMCDRVASRSSTSLVAYSDSDSETSLDSETSMTESEGNCIVGKESVEEHLCKIGKSNEVGSRMEANRSCMSELNFISKDSSFPEHKNTQDSVTDDCVKCNAPDIVTDDCVKCNATDIVTDDCVKCNGELDAVMGMMIRLRLHIQRLDHSRLFPYNVKSLLRLMESCEELYES